MVSGMKLLGVKESERMVRLQLWQVVQISAFNNVEGGCASLAQGVDTVAAERIMRRLLPGLPPLRFQHLMRVVAHEILHHIQDDHPTRQADLFLDLKSFHRNRHRVS